MSGNACQCGKYSVDDGTCHWTKRYLGKLNYNLDNKNKVSVRFSRLDSSTDVLLSNSSSAGFGNRRTSTLGLNFQNSNYSILENNRSIIGEWTSTMRGTVLQHLRFIHRNGLEAWYAEGDESRRFDWTVRLEN